MSPRWPSGWVEAGQRVNDERRPHLVLVGLPGAGKSTVGPLVAQTLGLPFVDLDLVIEAGAERSVGEIFALDGESTFRRLEREATAQLALRPSLVLSPGGGWMTQPDVVALLRPPGRIIHLAVSSEAALARMGNEVTRRPLLGCNNPLHALDDLRRRRAAAYATADAVVDTETLTIQELVAHLVVLATAWGVGVG